MFGPAAAHDEPNAPVEGPAPLVTPAEHQRILFAILVTLLVLPMLLIGRGPVAQASAGDGRVEVVAGAAAQDQPGQAGPRTTTAPPTSSSTTTSSTSTTIAPRPATTRPARSAPVTAAPTTTRPTAPERPASRPAAAPAPATRPPAPPTTAARPPNEASGQATYYGWKRGNCAQNQLPFGTVVTVTNLNNGRTATCVVGDRGTFGPPTIIDLDESVFSQIADPSEGRIPVRISW